MDVLPKSLDEGRNFTSATYLLKVLETTRYWRYLCLLNIIQFAETHRRLLTLKWKMEKFFTGSKIQFEWRLSIKMLGMIRSLSSSANWKMRRMRVFLWTKINWKSRLVSKAVWKILFSQKIWFQPLFKKPSSLRLDFRSRRPVNDRKT